MDSPKYLIIVTLIDGQNFSVPNGIFDKTEASVYAEARFGNESILKSDPIPLTNSNPEFVTELAWQLDKRSLHQLRVERKAIKLQIFMQTRDRSKVAKQEKNNGQTSETNGFQSDVTIETNKVELIGYTIIDIRSAEESETPKLRWLPLLNPKFRKSSYNRPEVQLALTLNRIDESANCSETKTLPSTSSLPKSNFTKKIAECSDLQTDSTTGDSSMDGDQLYKTCLDFTLNQDRIEDDEILENDIQIRSIDGIFYIYDIRDSCKSTLNDCDESYRITITIPFNSDLELLLMKEPESKYYLSVTLFGTTLVTKSFKELTSVETKEVKFDISTTHLSVLNTYFGINSSLVIKLHRISGEPLGIATIQLDQLCNLETNRRSIEGIFTLQSMLDHDIPSTVVPSIGVSVVLERVFDEKTEPSKPVSDSHIELAKEYFGEDIDDYLFKTLNDTHQLTLDSSKIENCQTRASDRLDVETETQNDDHHFCFTIDLKNFFYTPNQRLIPTLRELVVRYSYPFFGYKDTITTGASIPINSTNSIIVSGFCEFNFATTRESLLTALKEISLELEILACDQNNRLGTDVICSESIVATCNINLAETLNLCKSNMMDLPGKPISTTVSAPIYGLDDAEIGELQIYLCLQDLGTPTYNFKVSVENLDKYSDGEQEKTISEKRVLLPKDNHKLETFVTEAKSSLELWKEEYSNKLSDELKKKENERFKRMYQRFEAKEAKREQEFKKKMEELNNLEKRFRNSLSCIESLEKRLTNSFDQLKTKDALLDSRLETLDLKISKAISNIKQECESRLNSVPNKNQRFSDDNQLETKDKAPSKPTSRAIQVRRSSLRGTSSTVGIPVPIRSSSLVRGPTDGASTRIGWRPTGVVTTVINGFSTRPRSNSTRITLSKETQEKLASLRKEKAELLKRGCRPNDEVIQEINSLIEKLAC